MNADEVPEFAATAADAELDACPGTRDDGTREQGPGVPTGRTEAGSHADSGNVRLAPGRTGVDADGPRGWYVWPSSTTRRTARPPRRRSLP